MLPIYTGVTEIVNGFAQPDFLGVVIPEATENLIWNPSFEINANLFGGTREAMVRVATWQTRGAYGLQITPQVSGQSSFIYYSFVPLAASWYTLSMDFQGETGKNYFIAFSDNNDVPIVKKNFLASGFKERIFLTAYGLSATTTHVNLGKEAYTDVNPFYTDGWQLEKKAYPTTYCDGDMSGFVVGEKAYHWTGQAHYSTSKRLATTGSGGKMVNFAELSFTVLAVIGLGMGPVGNAALPSSQGGAFYQNTIDGVRQFNVVGNIVGGSPYTDLQRIRKELIDALKPDRTPIRQPTLLYYQLKDAQDNPQSDLLFLPCLFNEGLQGSIDNPYQERLGLSFSMFLPMILGDGNEGAELGYQQALAASNWILTRDDTGLWKKMSTGANQAVYVGIVGPDGRIYVGGNFTSMAGVGDTAYLAMWDPETAAWYSLGGTLDGAVRTLAFDSLGRLVVGGSFTAAGGAANTANIARVTLGVNTWAAIGTGATDPGRVQILYIDAQDRIYAGGTFDEMGGVTGTANLAMWDGAAWNSLGVIDNFVFAMTSDGVYLYIGGVFGSAGGVTVGGLARYKLASAAWSAMGTGVTVPGDYINVIKVASDGLVYAGGDFSAINGVSASRIAFWNGVDWFAMGAGVTGGVGTQVYTIGEDLQGLIYVGGAFSTAGGLTVPDGFATWNHSAWTFTDLTFPGSGAAAYFALMDTNRDWIVVGFSSTGTAYTGVNTTVTNSGSAEVRPVITLTGAGKVYRLRNNRDGKNIYFNLTLSSGERAVLDLEKQTFTSNLRGNIKSTILPGSDLSLAIGPGDNVISLFIGGTVDGSTDAAIHWRLQYRSVDGAVR